MQHIICSIVYETIGRVKYIMNANLFPLKLALEKNFCNRIEEQHYLAENIKGTRPTLIISPRRYGKTSLGVYVINKLKIPYAHLDLFPIVNISDLESMLLGGIGDILAAIESTSKKAMDSVASFFANFRVSFKWINSKIEVDMSRTEKSNPKQILTALKQLDAILVKKQKKAVLFLDEFQRLAQLEHSEPIEGAIRHIAQQSKNLVFIFSGSNRHLLSSMFNDSKRPLYKLCDKIALERIAEKDYNPFIGKLAKDKWPKGIENEVIETILDLSQRHSYYVNLLCSRLWRLDTAPSEKDIITTWHNYALEEKSSVFKELETLSSNQTKLLINLARYGATDALFGEEFLSFCNMPMSSVRQSMTALLEKDYVLLDQSSHYRILDPLIEYVLRVRPD